MSGDVLVDRLRYLARWGKISPDDSQILREAADYLESIRPTEEEETNAVPN